MKHDVIYFGIANTIDTPFLLLFHRDNLVIIHVHTSTPIDHSYICNIGIHFIVFTSFVLIILICMNALIFTSLCLNCNVMFVTKRSKQLNTNAKMLNAPCIYVEVNNMTEQKASQKREASV